MAIRDMNEMIDQMVDIADALDRIDFDMPPEPSDDADADDWREYGLTVADKLADAEKAVSKASNAIRG